jgi:hypothetical protein
MFGEEEVVFRPFKKTLKQLIKDLETIEDCPIEDFWEEIVDKFDKYNYDGVEDVVGIETWGNISGDGDYKLTARINHEDAYSLTLHTTVKTGKATITNVL